MEMVVIGRCLSRRFLICSNFKVVTILPGRLARGDEAYDFFFQLDVDNKQKIPARIQTDNGNTSFLVPAGINDLEKGIEKASAACSDVMPSWRRGFSRAFCSSQMNVIPCKTKRVFIAYILVETYIQRQYGEVG
jgi:hypothetical protein